MMKRPLPLVLLVVLSWLMIACGSQASSSGGSSNTYGSTGSTPTTAPSTSGPVIKTATATVKGTTESILTNAQGMTLYYFTPDTASTSACTGACASNWPALLSQGSGTPGSATTLPGPLTIVTTANGSQVAYNGHLLYTFSGDSAAGQTNGEGIAGKWFVVTPNVKPLATQQTTPQAKGRGY